MGYLIDSDWVIDHLANRGGATDLLAPLAPLGMSISIVTYGEIYEGVLFSRRPEESEASFLSFLRYADVLPLDEALMRRFAGLRGSLRKKGERIADPDLIIAATALHHDLTLVTRNRKHFTRIPALKLHPIPE